MRFSLSFFPSIHHISALHVMSFFQDSLFFLSLIKHLNLCFDLFSTVDLRESSESPSLTNLLRSLSVLFCDPTGGR